jgi:hypothetical protein
MAGDSGKIEAQARLRGGPDDGALRFVTTDDSGYLPGFPITGDAGASGTYMPTWERDDDRVIYQWQEGPDPKAPTPVDAKHPWPQIARQLVDGVGAGVFWFVGIDDPNITIDPVDGRRRLNSRPLKPSEIEMAEIVAEARAQGAEFFREAHGLLERVAERSAGAPDPHGPIPFDEERVKDAYVRAKSPQEAPSLIRIRCGCGWEGPPVAYLAIHMPPD